MFSKSDYRYFSKARKVASLSDFVRVHMGCIAVYQGNIIGMGYNTNKTHPQQAYYNKYRQLNYNTDNCIPKLHAEVNCINSIRHLDINFSRVKLYIYRIRYDRPHGTARPCLACMAAMRDLGIRDIYYTTNEGFAYERLEEREYIA